MKPLVSILIPAFNAQGWIADTLRSAISQTWPRKEIIVVDDGSRDQTLAMARQFASHGVRVVAHDNQGAAAARNRAFSISQGDYVQWLDADDLLAPDKIARQVEMLDRCGSKQTLLSAAWAPFMYRHQRAKFAPNALWCDLATNEFLLRKIGENLFMPNATWLTSRELTESAGPWDTRQCVDDDGEYFCRVLLKSDGIRFVPEARMYYRVAASGSLSHVGLSDDKLEAQWRSVQLHIRYLMSLEDSQRVRTACVRFLQVNLNHFDPRRPDIVAQIATMARDLGGRIDVPRLSWKYAWIAGLLGRDFAKRSQVALSEVKRSCEGSWDKVLFRIENRFGRRA